MIKPSQRLASKLAIGDANRWAAEMEEEEARDDEAYYESWERTHKLFPDPPPKKTWFERLFGL